MEKFIFLKKFMLPNEEARNDFIYKSYKHILFPLKEDDINKIGSTLAIPSELKLFYHKIGYGFFFQEHSSFDRLLDPYSFKQINLREDFYKFDPELELYEKYYILKNKLIFFEINEGVYLLISREDRNGQNAIYYFDKKIADSLEEFLIRFDQEGHYFENKD